MKLFFAWCAALLVTAAAIVTYATLYPGKAPIAGTTLPSATALFETSLASRIGTSDTTMTLAANSVGGTSLSGYNCFTIDEGRTENEFVCGTISGTTVTNLERGISYTNGTTTSVSLTHAHRVGADVKITDHPLLARLQSQNNGTDTYPHLLNYTYSPDYTAASTTALASVGFVNHIFSTSQTGYWGVNSNSIYNLNTNNVGIGTTSPHAKLSLVGNLEQYGSYEHFGPVAANNSNCSSFAAPTTCFEIWGTDNTVGGLGVEQGIGNTSNGANAYSGYFWNNDLASDNLSDHYAFAGYTGSHYTDTTFGDAEASSSLLFFQNTDGAIAFMPKGGTYFYGTTASTSLFMKIDAAGANFTATTSILAFNAYGVSTSTITGNLTIAKNASTTNLVISGTCAGCTNGRVQVTGTQALDTTSGNVTSATASCTGSKVALGGGESFSGGTTGYYVIANNPASSQSWSASVKCNSTSLGTCNSGTLTTYAICVNP